MKEQQPSQYPNCTAWVESVSPSGSTSAFIPCKSISKGCYLEYMRSWAMAHVSHGMCEKTGETPDANPEPFSSN